MTKKIEWYREVLELEPGSRVFFPLAKLLAADGQVEDAIAALRQGILRHPDHVEARFLLVELLHVQNAGPALTGEIDDLGELLASYPGFWKAWSERLSTDPDMRDASLAMALFSAALQGKQVSWATLIEQGLQALLHSPGAHCAPQAKEERAAPVVRIASPADTPPQQPVAAPVISTPQRAAPSPAPASQGRAEVPEERPEEAVARPRLSINVNNKPPAAPREHAPSRPRQTQTENDEDEEAEEAFSLRTRSMAEVLAEQGDIAGALDIYTELVLTARTEEKNSLKARAEELSQRLAAPAPGEPRVADKAAAQSGDSNRLVSLLESLAQRLEARAR